ncbi:transporter [Alkalihalobacillus alcalophilus ATCC 27647 = CGMCC 1.3604]|uniref:Transporter n=1 Tax=Alkalihalobacillus alcalophilus ATCC 27647 = CGMCC 1.3604 TaxID=1218173 RepID=J8Q8B0_ALKAL|nr:sodium-dependent transporter [Alkalihalobacillus alcalophilus]AFV25832.1 sodium ion:solute symporter transporter [Alkalihalobacillus alcalophilus ATCC 27647 = CGMCC 1.3604]KGA95594.1 transporter [Alkalihalobacillus alcalophilus ATCC 27647 = CGMCC 1.3604]MED1564027.1 sodium-dependent transporter [Alkalihalobacillus alcalophilus]THG91665.1 transporter [Alkalihalobacillus alcalophilus ATCC 27647 = CGMCC 1.3604]
MEGREQWGTRAGFVLAAIGSAVGLGNIWRFPYVAYENGGGAFLIPYLFALLTAGIPLLIMEFTIGQKYRGSAPLSYARLNKKAEWIGWWQVAISFVISTFYAVIIAWAISYTYFSFRQTWGSNPTDFLLNDFLQIVDPGQLGSFVPTIFIPLLIVWVIALGVLFKGVKKGIEFANRIFIPLLVVMFLILVIRAVTLDGAMVGLDAFFKPNWEEIMNPAVWVAAYGQIFFSLSIGFAIMITYSSYLPRKSDLNNNAFITGFSNSSFEILAGIGVFAIIGFMATQQGTSVDEVAADGIALAFMVFPEIINSFPGLNGLFGALFFGSLVMAGLTSLVSIIETYVSALQDKFKITRTKAVAIGGGLSALISILYATQGGLWLLDTVDYFINHFGVALAGLVSVIAVAWFMRKLPDLQKHTNELSDFRVGLWWKICLGVITPLVLGFMLYQNLILNLTSNYEGYPTYFIIIAGWTVAILAIVIGFLFTIFKWKNNKNSSDDLGGF